MNLGKAQPPLGLSIPICEVRLAILKILHSYLDKNILRDNIIGLLYT